MKRGWIFVMMLVITLTFSSLSRAQSLAEAARKAKAKKDRPKATRVYTNKDIPSKARLKNQEPLDSSPTTKKSSNHSMNQLNKKIKEEARKSWLDEYRKVHERILEIRRRLDELDNEIKIIRMGYMASDFPDQTQKLRSQMQNLLGERESLKKELTQAERTLSEIRRKARADGVRPGDFRKIDREIERRSTRPG